MTNPPDSTPTPDPAPPGGLGSGAMRIGDTERTSALDALAEHLADGRISLDEYGERSARVTVARTVDELAELFDDLPAPHPVISVPGAAVPARLAGTAPARSVATGGHELDAADRRSRAQKIVAAAASASVFVALALFFITGTWLWFLLIPAISGIAQAVWGPDWKEPARGRPREIGDGPGNR